MEKIPYFGQTLTRWRVGQSTFLAFPEKGALLMNWNVTLGDGSVRDVIYWPELKSFDGFEKARGGNPILFPFCGRSFDRGEIHHWRSPDDVRRPIPIHGFARHGDFRVTRLDARGFAAQLIPGEVACAAYPYDYEFVVTYRFASFGLACEFTLKNLDKQPIPWCAGHHFYFTLPWSEGLKRSDYLIRIPAGKSLKQDMSGTGKMVSGPVFAREESLGNNALVDTIHTELRSNTVVFGEKGRPGDISVRLGTEQVPPTGSAFVTWTPDDTVPFYCVEPWMGLPNAPENKLGMQWVPPGQTQSFVVEISL